MKFANPTVKRDMTLEEVSKGADVLLGVSVANVFTKKIMSNLNKNPVIFALANPVPEILPSLAEKYRPDCIIATGRSDFPNQINNIMCFPFLFRATLDVRASQINHEMMMAAADAIQALAKEDVPDSVYNYIPGRKLIFGPEYIVPTPFDPRLMKKVTVSVAKAAEKSGNALTPIKDYEEYKNVLDVIHRYSW